MLGTNQDIHLNETFTDALKSKRLSYLRTNKSTEVGNPDQDYTVGGGGGQRKIRTYAGHPIILLNSFYLLGNWMTLLTFVQDPPPK